MSTIGIDQSKRSTAIISLRNDGSIIDLELINAGAEWDKEYLIQYQWDRISAFINNQKSVRAIALEGLAFGSNSQGFDLLCGIHWYIRTQLLYDYPTLYGGVIPVTMWRSKILTKDEQKAWKAEYAGNKVGLKHGVLSKIPQNDRHKIDLYLEEHKDRINEARNKDWKPGSKSNKYKECIFDLGDAWGIGMYRLSLFPVSNKPTLLRRM